MPDTNNNPQAEDGLKQFFPRAALWLLDAAVKLQKERIPVHPPLLQAAALRGAMATVSQERFAELRREASPEEKVMLDLLRGMNAYQNQVELLQIFEQAIQKKGHSFSAITALEKLISLGILEKGSRRNRTPTIRIVDLYAFNPDWEITRRGRR